jgi:hypothetical protein
MPSKTRIPVELEAMKNPSRGTSKRPSALLLRLGLD